MPQFLSFSLSPSFDDKASVLIYDLFGCLSRVYCSTDLSKQILGDPSFPVLSPPVTHPFIFFPLTPHAQPQATHHTPQPCMIPLKKYCQFPLRRNLLSRVLFEGLLSVP